MCNKAIAHSRRAASVLLVTTSHQMTYTTLVFHRRYDSRCRPGNKHGWARACREHTEEENAQREAQQWLLNQCVPPLLMQREGAEEPAAQNKCQAEWPQRLTQNSFPAFLNKEKVGGKKSVQTSPKMLGSPHNRTGFELPTFQIYSPAHHYWHLCIFFCIIFIFSEKNNVYCSKLLSLIIICGYVSNMSYQ